MQMKTLISAFMATVFLVAMPVNAGTTAKAKTYDEGTFIKMLGNQSMKQVTEMLGNPDKKQISVKPANAEGMIGRPLDKGQKPVSVEMWYYSNVVRYAPNKTYNSTELTFVNGRCSNVTFFNNK